jgi:hypothetical protein
MIRQSLDADSVYADVALHGSGLTSLQFRDEKGNVTFVENWQTLLKRYHDFCAKEGITPVDITSFESSSR